MEATSNEEDSGQEWVKTAQPWARFWARIVDITVLSLPVGLVIGILFPTFATSMADKGNSQANLFGLLILPLVLLLDAAIISITGSSIGKSLAGIRVETQAHEKLPMETSLKRNLLLWVKGLILGLPLFSLIGYWNGYKEVQESGSTSWDKDTSTQMVDVGGNLVRTSLTAILAILCLAFSNALSRM